MNQGDCHDNVPQIEWLAYIADFSQSTLPDPGGQKLATMQSGEGFLKIHQIRQDKFWTILVTRDLL